MITTHLKKIEKENDPKEKTRDEDIWKQEYELNKNTKKSEVKSLFFLQGRKDTEYKILRNIII